MQLYDTMITSKRNGDIMDDKIRMIEKIEALLRQAESTNIPEEAKTFTAKAQELLTKHALSEFDLMGVKTARMDDHIETIAVLVNDPKAERKASLLSAVARANEVQVVRGHKTSRRQKNQAVEAGYGVGTVRTISSDRESKNYRLMYLTGFSKDLEATTLIYTSLLIQAKSEIKHANVPSWENKSTWVSHFFLGFTAEVGLRLRAGRNASVTTIRAEASLNGVDLLPVLVERTKRVSKAYEEVWSGNLGKRRSAGYTRTTTSGYKAGLSAGQRTDVGNARIGGIAGIGAGR